MEYEIKTTLEVTDPPVQTRGWLAGLLTSRRFWVAMLALIVIMISVVVPDFQIDTEQGAALLVIVVSYLVGVSVDPGPGGWRGVLKSRKFWAAFVGLFILFLDAFHLVLPVALSAEQLISIAVLFGGYISSIAFERPKWIQGS